MRNLLFPISVALMLAACGGPKSDEASGNAGDANLSANVEEVPANEEPVDANLIETADDGSTSAGDGFVGKWTGVEGLALDVTRAAAPGTFDLKVTLLDGTSNYTGTVEGDVIRFRRDGKDATLRHVSGDETGLKYLAGKKDCVMIQPAEGFCRD